MQALSSQSHAATHNQRKTAPLMMVDVTSLPAATVSQSAAQLMHRVIATAAELKTVQPHRAKSYARLFLLINSGFMLFWLSTFEAILQHPKSWHLTLSWLVPLQRMLNNFQCSHYTASINPPSISLWHALHRTCKTYSCHKRKGTDAENGALVMERKC